MKYNSQTNGEGNILAGIESLLITFETRSDVDSELGTMLFIAKDLSELYHEIPIQEVLELEQKYESKRAHYEQKGSVPFRFPVKGPELRIVLDTLNELTD